MKKKIFLLLASISLGLCSVALYAQQSDPFEPIREDYNRSGTVFYMYDHNVPPCAKPPRGFKPFYISHYGRHGARNHSSSSDFDLVLKLLETAGERGILTPRGQELLERYRHIYPLLQNRGGDLCDRGFEQQYKIAHNMYKANRRVFRGHARIDAVSTIVPRCILTMSAFTDQLMRENSGLRVEKQASNATMGYLNPFSLNNPDVQYTDEGYNNKYAYWQKDFHHLCDSLLHPESVFEPLLTDLSILDEIQDAEHLERALFATTAGLQCNGQIGDSLWEFFPEDEICRLYECHNFRFYVSKGADTLYQKGRQWAFVWRTLQDVIDKADADLASGEYAARLRFGHDITVMSLLVLLDADGYNIPARGIADVKNVFRSYEFPMSLNTQFIFYRNRRGEILVRLLYNERDLALPVKDCGTPYFYRWEDFREFALQRIAVAQKILATTQAAPKVKNY